jgi:hypothetical protein
MKPATTKKRVGSKRKKPSKKRFIEVTLVEGKGGKLDFAKEVHPLFACLVTDMYVQQPKTFR